MLHSASGVLPLAHFGSGLRNPKNGEVKVLSESVP